MISLTISSHFKKFIHQGTHKALVKNVAWLYHNQGWEAEAGAVAGRSRPFLRGAGATLKKKGSCGSL